MAERISNSFYYPAYRGEPSRRMCAAGQRRAASELWNLMVDGGDIGKDETFHRAVKAERRLANKADLNKHDLISYVVAKIWADGMEELYMNEQGDYRFERFSGEIIPVNIFTEIEKEKQIY